jgi:Bacteriophage head to tail connecting protein
MSTLFTQRFSGLYEEHVTEQDLRLRRFQQGRLLGLRNNRYSWWTHARELADFILPRRYKWLITQNQQNRGSPINQHILDSTGTIAARNLAAGMMSGISSPTRPWFKLKAGRIDSTQTSPTSLWLADCERRMYQVFAQSNFYTAMAIFYFDLVVFGTAVMLIYEDYDNVINCINPAFGEYYVDIDGAYRPVIFYREFTYTIAQTVDEFGWEATSPMVRQFYDLQDGANLTREIIIAHAIEPNTEPGKYGVPAHFKYRETYWEWGGATNPQGGTSARGYLRKRGFNERAAIIGRWDLVANDPYGRSPGMDALPDIKQLQQETRRKAQGIDKGINPPLVADVQLKNQPASLLPGGITFLQGMMSTGNDGMKPAYGSWKPDIASITEDLAEVRQRIKDVFFNSLFQVASQFETRSNITAMEWDMRKSESLMMLTPVIERLQSEVLAPSIDRVWGIMSRAGIIPPPPMEISGRELDIEYTSMLTLSQRAAQAGSIERLFQMSGQLAGIDPAIIDNIDFDMAFDIYANLLNNDPRMIRSPQQLAAIRAQRAQQQAQQQQLQSAETLAKAGQNASAIDVGGGQNLVQRMVGGPPA